MKVRKQRKVYYSIDEQSRIICPYCKDHIRGRSAFRSHVSNTHPGKQVPTKRPPGSEDALLRRYPGSYGSGKRR